MPLFKLSGILSSSNIWLVILHISVANSAFANLKCSACIPFSSAVFPLFSFRIACFISASVAGGIFSLLAVTS
jgi:hypothetical protein